MTFVQSSISVQYELNTKRNIKSKRNHSYRSYKQQTPNITQQAKHFQIPAERSKVFSIKKKKGNKKQSHLLTSTDFVSVGFSNRALFNQDLADV